MRMDARITLRVPASSRVWMSGFAERKRVSEAEGWRRVLEAGMQVLGASSHVSDKRQTARSVSEVPTVRPAQEQSPAIVALLQDRIEQMQTVNLTSPASVTLPVLAPGMLNTVETDFKGRPLRPGFRKVEQNWAEHALSHQRVWIGELDADGNPLEEP